LQKAHEIMSQRTKLKLRAIPRTTMRRLRNIPSYFFLVWRWTWWVYALAWIALNPKHPLFLYVFLGITLVQTLAVTLYSPVFKLLLPGTQSRQARASGNNRAAGRWLRRRARPLASDEEAEALPPLARSTNVYKNIAIYGLDVVICGLATYFSAIYAAPPFGNGSPFYRYGFSTIFVAAFVFRYRGGLAAAIGYDLFILLGVFVHPPLSIAGYSLQVQDLLGSLFDAPLVAIFAAYMSTLLDHYTRDKRREQDSVRRQKSLLRVSERLLESAGDRQQFLRQNLEEIRKGGHFARLVVALIGHAESGAELETFLDTGVAGTAGTHESESIALRAAQTGSKYTSFEPTGAGAGEEGKGLARLYLPMKREQDGQVYMVIACESIRGTPFDERQERFLNIVGAQLVIALENIRLTEQTAELAAAAERGRIAREMHDGVAQLIYMLSLNIETCSALVNRLAGMLDEEEAQALAPVEERLEKLITLSKQALWETRHYMFTLKPLIHGTSTLTQMLASQLHEFESISGLPVELEVEGEEELPGDRRRARRQAQVGTAIFRITQEALTNAYKHAAATRMHVLLRYEPGFVAVEIGDNGKGLPVSVAVQSKHDGGDDEQQRFYSGHGVRGMRERAEELGGTCQVSQRRTGGVSVQARIPL
jgi:signal transduction histidine kinase